MRSIFRRIVIPIIECVRIIRLIVNFVFTFFKKYKFIKQTILFLRRLHEKYAMLAVFEHFSQRFPIKIFPPLFDCGIMCERNIVVCEGKCAAGFGRSDCKNNFRILTFFPIAGAPRLNNFFVFNKFKIFSRGVTVMDRKRSADFSTNLCGTAGELRMFFCLRPVRNPSTLRTHCAPML